MTSRGVVASSRAPLSFDHPSSSKSWKCPRSVIVPRQSVRANYRPDVAFIPAPAVRVRREAKGSGRPGGSCRPWRRGTRPGSAREPRPRAGRLRFDGRSAPPGHRRTGTPKPRRGTDRERTRDTGQVERKRQGAAPPWPMSGKDDGGKRGIPEPRSAPGHACLRSRLARMLSGLHWGSGRI